MPHLLALPTTALPARTVSPGPAAPTAPSIGDTHDAPAFGAALSAALEPGPDSPASAVRAAPAADLPQTAPAANGHGGPLPPIVAPPEATLAHTAAEPAKAGAHPAKEDGPDDPAPAIAQAVPPVDQAPGLPTPPVPSAPAPAGADGAATGRVQRRAAGTATAPDREQPREAPRTEGAATPSPAAAATDLATGGSGTPVLEPVQPSALPAPSALAPPATKPGAAGAEPAVAGPAQTRARGGPALQAPAQPATNGPAAAAEAQPAPEPPVTPPASAPHAPTPDTVAATPASLSAPAPGPEAAAQAPPAPPPPAHAQLAPVFQTLAPASPGAPQQLVIRLDPTGLGHVQVRIQRTENGPAHVVLAVERADTLMLLMRDRPQLNQALDAAGLASAGRTLQFDLSSGDGRQPPSAFGGGGLGSGFGGQGAGGEGPGGHGPPGRDAPANRRPTRASWLRAGIDITA